MRLAGFLLQNLAVLALFVLALFAYGWWRSDAGIVDRELPVHFPQAPAHGVLGEPVTASGVTVIVHSLQRRRSTSGTADLVLSSRARTDELTDFVTVHLEVANDSSAAVSLDYYGSGQRADLLLGTRTPQPRVELPLLPRDVLRLVDSQPLPARVLEPGERVSGVLVYAVNRQAGELALAILPARFLTARGHSLPSFEIDLGRPLR